jgi:hypothetical protein
LECNFLHAIKLSLLMPSSTQWVMSKDAHIQETHRSCWSPKYMFITVIFLSCIFLYCIYHFKCP